MTRKNYDDRIWIWRHCIAKNSRKPQSYQFAAVYHGMDHIYRDHQVRAPSLAEAKSQQRKAATVWLDEPEEAFGTDEADSIAEIPVVD